MAQAKTALENPLPVPISMMRRGRIMLTKAVRNRQSIKPRDPIGLVLRSISKRRSSSSRGAGLLLTRPKLSRACGNPIHIPDKTEFHRRWECDEILLSQNAAQSAAGLETTWEQLSFAHTLN